MKLKPGVHEVSPSEAERLRAEATAVGATVYLLSGDEIVDRDSFFDAVRATLPLDPLLVGYYNSWDALSDSIWVGVDQTWEVLEADNETLDLMEQHFNGEDVDWYGCRPDELLISLLAQSEKWVLIFEPNFDQIDHILRLSPTDAVNKLKSVLNWQNERLGFIAISPE